MKKKIIIFSIYSNPTPSVSRTTPKITWLQLINDRPTIKKPGANVPIAVQIRLKFNFDILFFSNNLSLIIVAILMNNQQTIYGIAAIKPFLKLEIIKF